jgi:hypothetical protein
VDTVSLAKMVALNNIKMHPQYGVTIFTVEPSKETLNDAFMLEVAMEKTMLLGIGYKGLSLISPKKKNVIKSIVFSKLDQIKAFTNAIMIYEKEKAVPYKFNTGESY